MTRYGASIALALTLALSSCGSSERRGSGSGGSGGEEETGGSTGTGGKATGGSTGTGGSTSTGGSTGTGGSTSTGGSTGTGGSTSTGGSTGTGGSGAPDAGGKLDMASAWPNCLEPVFSGVTPAEFCMVYANVCTFTGTSHYASMADCMAKFKGMSNDGDACKSGHLCRAATLPSMKEADCASSGTASCRN